MTAAIERGVAGVRLLSELLEGLDARLDARLVGEDVAVTGISLDSRDVRAGDLFVAIDGLHTDGTEFVRDALGCGAVAICARDAMAGVATIVTSDPRSLLPYLAAALHGHPARELTLIGITGTLGKTSTALLVQAALGASGRRVGSLGSLGVRVRGEVVDTGMTTPDAPAIHRALRAMLDRGVELAAMEVTSHALALHRVDGLTFALGIVTNLVPDEHLEFHDTPDDYLRTKARFFPMLEDGAPLVINHDDHLVREMVAAALRDRQRRVVTVSAAGTPGATVMVQGVSMDVSGSAFALRITEPLPRLDGGEIAPSEIPLVIPVFGVQQVENAALAATAALIAGASPRGIAEAVAELRPIHRRMEIVRRDPITILDDTAGNPLTLRAVFESIRAIPHERLLIAFGIRGTRGVRINRRLAAALADLVQKHGATIPTRLVVTESSEAAGPRDRVTVDERECVLGVLRDAGARFSFEATVEMAVQCALEGWRSGDLVLLLGAQGMDTAAEVADRVVTGLRPE